MMKKRYIGMMGFLLISQSLFAEFKVDTTQLKTIRWTPSPVEVSDAVRSKKILNGTWDFFPSLDSKQWNKYNTQETSHTIEVPGEWTMQGYKHKENEAVLYRKCFDLEAGWNDQNILLQFEAVYSDCEVWLNGKLLGKHHNGFTPFEFDITSIAKSKQNVLLVKVKNEGLANNQSSGSQYAMHPLGGISRDVSLIAVPKTYVQSFHGATFFDKNYCDAQLLVTSKINNTENHSIKENYTLDLFNEKGDRVVTKKVTFTVDPHSVSQRVDTLKVKAPTHWNPEKPYLYQLSGTLNNENLSKERVSKKIGFRQIEVRGNQVFVNNHPIKLRGVCRHEVWPSMGRVLPKGQWERDVKLFKEGNVNYIRTSHYPPSEKLLAAADSLGMFVEVEAPYCWAKKSEITQENFFDQMIRPAQEMIEQMKTHPAVLIWSIGNESFDYKEIFTQSAAWVQKADSTRPRNFSNMSDINDGGELEIGNYHYPGPNGPNKYAHNSRPEVFDEFMHLNAYNRKEQATDPGLRDEWGELFASMWNQMYHSQGTLGGAIWAGIDDTFILPDSTAVGYGTWGPVDGWRRPKPEYWHMKKSYSPIKIEWIKREGDKLKLKIENQGFFVDLKEYKIETVQGESVGTVYAKALPGESTEVMIPIAKGATDITIHITDPMNQYEVDRYHYALESHPTTVGFDTPKKIKTITNSAGQEIVCGDLVLKYNKAHESIELKKGNEWILNHSPKLLLLPITGEGGGVQLTPNTPHFEAWSPTCTQHQITKVETYCEGNVHGFLITEHYAEAVGTQKIGITPQGKIEVKYEYRVLKEINPRQVGLVWELNEDYNTLSWKRVGQWSCYPKDHIGRLKGTAKLYNASAKCGLEGPKQYTESPWSQDQTVNGTNDFRSTKRNVLEATLSNPKHKITLWGEGLLHSRSWIEEGVIHWLVASYDNPGGEGFLRSHATLKDKPIKVGDTVEGKMTFTVE